LPARTPTFQNKVGVWACLRRPALRWRLRQGEGFGRQAKDCNRENRREKIEKEKGELHHV